MKKELRVVLIAFLSVLLGIFLTACGGGGGGGSVNAGGGISSQASGTVGSNGGTIEVTDPYSPIKGTKVIVPQDALDSSETVKITINYEDQLPAPTESGTVSASKVIVLTKDSNYNFKQPVKVTIPYIDDQMEAGDIPAVFCWDSIYNKYRAVGIKEINTTNKTVTFTTVHFSKFVALAIKSLANLLIADSGFRPGIDGFFHPNFGSYDSPGGGSCLGMANYSIWYFDSKKVIDGTGLYYKYREG